MPDDAPQESGPLMRCISCRSFLMQSGEEPHRFVCSTCGQNYHLTVRLEPVAPLRRLALPEGGDGAGRGS
jgi:hypothetical protein